MGIEDIDTKQIAEDLSKKYPNSGIKSIEVDQNTGKSVFILEPTKQNLAFSEKAGVSIKPRAYGSTISRDGLSRQTMDLSLDKSPYEEDPKELFKKADKYYYTNPLLGSVTNILATLSMKGFENDIDDDNIKQFYDNWVFDVGLDEVLEWIFLDLFKIGHVTTYKVIGKYEPKVSNLSNIPGKKNKTTKNKAELDRINKLHSNYEDDRKKEINEILKTAKKEGYAGDDLRLIEDGAKKSIWSKGHMPLAYTVLNPKLVNIEGNLLFDNVSTKLTPPPELSKLLKKDTSELTEDERQLIKTLPNDLKKVAQQGGEYQLDSRLVGSVTYRKQPYERYAKPRSTRIFETINYKEKLKEADLSTLDGISNYILKITIGSDEYPVTDQTQLEAVAKLFDTPSKSFDVVWNHTLNIEKIVSPEIEAILGSEKYKQVNEDMTSGLAITRAIVDGSGDTSDAEVSLLTKGIMEEINYARRQVERWIFREYRQIAEAMGFDRFPKIRWDESVLRDIILYMNTLATLVDRRMLSYKTSLEALGFDYDNELNSMKTELPLVKEGIFGITGSPFQKAADSTGTQPTQKAPKGTPSAGRPKGTTKPKDTNTDPKKQPGQKPTKPKKTSSLEDNKEAIKNMDAEKLLFFLDGAREELSDEAYVKFLDLVGEVRNG